ncbi:MAG: FecR family protein [Steroidobacteraceae bacterium]
MSDERDPRAGGPDEIGRLIAAAGPRPEPATQIEASVRSAVERAWQDSVAQRNARRRVRWLALAASLAAITGGALWFALREQARTVPADATLLAVRGNVTVTVAHDRALIAAGSRLPFGTTVRTARNGFVLMTVADESMRVGPGSSMRIGSGGHVRLTDGRIYVETSDSRESAPPLIVETPFGRVSHLGTQFQVVVDRQGMAVSVRSGHVRVKDASGQAQRLSAGQGVDVQRGGGVQRLSVSPYGPEWAWANSLVPDLPIDGRPLSDFLSWYAREMGVKLVLLGPGTATAVKHTVLSGSVAGMTPDQALDAVMASTRFEYDKKIPGELRISMRVRAD